MADTGFYVPAGKLGRFTTFYPPDAETGGLRVFDQPGGWWSAPPKMPDAAASLVSTADDLWAFASMLAAEGGGLLSAESVRQMTHDRMSAADRAENRMFVGGHSGWGLMMLVPAAGGAAGLSSSRTSGPRPTQPSGPDRQQRKHAPRHPAALASCHETG